MLPPASPGCDASPKTTYGQLAEILRTRADLSETLCATYVSPGVKVDAGGFVIVGRHVHKVPGWQPDGPEYAKAKIALASAAFTVASLMPAGEQRGIVEKSVASSLMA